MNKLTQSELRMQMLAGVITESEYKAKLEEVSALMKYASKDAKARDVEQSDREYIATRQKRDKLAKELFNKASYRDLSNVQKDRVNNQLTEDQNEEKDSLNEHYVAGGIVGIGAITQIPPRAKTDYEDAFEHFLGQKYSINEEMDDEMVDSNMLKSYIDQMISLADDMEYTSEMVDELENLKNTLSDGSMSKEDALDIMQKTIDITEDDIDAAEALNQAISGDYELGEGKKVEKPYNY